MRTRTAWEDSEYIVNLTKNLVGENVLGKLRTARYPRIPRSLFCILEPKLTPKLQEMGDDTLGRICGYGTSEGFHRRGPLLQTIGFINLTGFKHVLHYDIYGQGYYYRFECTKDVTDLMIMMAVATIVCIAYDIIHQPEYTQRRIEEKDEEYNESRYM